MMIARLACLLVVLIPLSRVLSPRPAHGSLLVDLRAVSGSGVTFESNKSVIVTAASVGGVIDFEMWGVVRGSNADISDEALSTIAGSVLTTQFGRGGISGSLLNTGEIGPGISRGVTADFPSPGTSAGKLQNLDNDPDLEIGGSVGAELMVARRSPTIPLLRDTDGGTLAEFLVYRFSLPITSILARDARNDYTVVDFQQYRIQPLSARWHEDDRAQNPRASSLNGSGVWVHLPGLPESRRFAAANEPVPEPTTIGLAFIGLAAIAWVRYRRRISL